MARVLLAEDDTAMRSMLMRSLTGDGHAVTEAADGQAALDLLLANPGGFDVLVTDVEMPVMNGIDLAQKGMAAKPALKVLLISGMADGLKRGTALNSASVRTLSKPVTLEQVRAEVKALLA